MVKTKLTTYIPSNYALMFVEEASDNGRTMSAQMELILRERYGEKVGNVGKVEARPGLPLPVRDSDGDSADSVSRDGSGQEGSDQAARQGAGQRARSEGGG